MPGAGDTAGDQIFGHRDEVVIAALLVLADGGLVPGRSELSTATDVGHHQHPTAFEPGAAVARRVPRVQRDFKAAVAIQQCRVAPVGLGTSWPDKKVGYAGAIGRGGKTLLRAQSGGVEQGGACFQQFECGQVGGNSGIGFGPAEEERIRCQEIGVAEQVALGQRVVQAHRIVQAAHAQRAGAGRVD